jgi:hypothetical protein
MKSARGRRSFCQRASSPVCALTLFRGKAVGVSANDAHGCHRTLVVVPSFTALATASGASAAVQTGPNRQFVYVIGADSRVEARPVTVAQTEGR